MGITETARAKAQAAVSEAEADVTELRSELARAQRLAEGTSAAGDMLDTVKETPLVGSLTAGMRDQTGVDEANAKADVDRLTAELRSAETKLELAKKAQAAIVAVTGGDD